MCWYVFEEGILCSDFPQKAIIICSLSKQKHNLVSTCHCRRHQQKQSTSVYPTWCGLGASRQSFDKVGTKTLCGRAPCGHPVVGALQGYVWGGWVQRRKMNPSRCPGRLAVLPDEDGDRERGSMVEVVLAEQLDEDAPSYTDDAESSTAIQAPKRRMPKSK